MNIVFLDSKTIGNVPNIEILKEFGHLDIYETTAKKQTSNRVKEADIIITNKVIIDQSIIENAHRLKLICIAATGINNVDLAYAQEKGVIVKNVCDYSTESVAQTTFAIVFQLLNKITYFDDYVKSMQYAESGLFTHHGKHFWQLSGKRYGIIGLGTIGKRVAVIATVFGAEVVYYSTSGKNINHEYERLSLTELLQTSDIISIHAPLNTDTEELIGYNEIKKMKKKAYLINMGRGGIVKEDDLAKALNKNLIAGAGLDVFTREPIHKDNPLLKIKNADNLVLTPHIAWASIEARTLLIEKIYTNIKEFIRDNR